MSVAAMPSPGWPIRFKTKTIGVGALILGLVAALAWGLVVWQGESSVVSPMGPLADARGGTLNPGLMHTAAPMSDGRAPESVLTGTPVAAASAAGSSETFEDACLKPIRLKHFADAIEGCGRFVDVAGKGGHAHAALAAIYASRSYINVAASVRHAQLAADAGDARGKFMVAFHQLTGVSGQPFDLERTRALLEQAKAGGVQRAAQYLSVIDDSRKCREQAAFKLFEQPLFCLFRPEVNQLLMAKGMIERQKDLEQWVDSYRPGDVLVTADSAMAVYDRDPQEELQRLARFSYRFTAGDGSDRLKLLRQALTDKYGQPEKLNAKEATGGSSEWQLADGVRISLGKDEDGNAQVSYTLPLRWEARGSHLKREAELVQNAQITRDQMAL